MCVYQNRWRCVWLSHEVDGGFSLWEQLVPQLHGKVVGYIGQDAKEVRLDVLYWYLSDVATVTSRWCQLYLHLVFIANDVLHYLWDLVIRNVLDRDNPCSAEARHQWPVLEGSDQTNWHSNTCVGLSLRCPTASPAPKLLTLFRKRYFLDLTLGGTPQNNVDCCPLLLVGAFLAVLSVHCYHVRLWDHLLA